MRALILSDIHSNIDALDAVLAAAPAHDVVWNLGDVVGYGAEPSPVIKKVREMGGVLVRGNHDRACCGLMKAEHFNSIAMAAVEWTKRQLDADSTEWLRALPSGPIDPSPGATSGRDIACVHGSLLDEDQYILSMRDAREQRTKMRTEDAHPRIAFFGHTHIQGGFATNPEGDWFDLKPVYIEDDAAESYELDLRDSAAYLINPGSVGQPRDHDWRSAFAVYDDNAGEDAAARVTFHRVPYDVRLAQMRIQRAGLPDMLGSRLRVGR